MEPSVTLDADLALKARVLDWPVGPSLPVGPSYLLPDFVAEAQDDLMRPAVAMATLSTTPLSEEDRPAILAQWAYSLARVLNGYSGDPSIDTCCVVEERDGERAFGFTFEFGAEARAKTVVGEASLVIAGHRQASPNSGDGLPRPGVECIWCEETPVLDKIPWRSDLVQLFLSYEQNARLVARLRYDAGLYRPETMQRLLGRLKVVGTSGDTTGTLPMVPGEVETLMHWSQGASEPPFPRERTLASIFHEHAVRNPSKMAIVTEGVAISYGELDERSTRLAEVLVNRGVKRHDVVALLMQRSAVALEAMLAVIKAGAAYLPINPTDPEARVRYMLEDSGAVIGIVADEQPCFSEPVATPILQWTELTKQASTGETRATLPDGDATDVAYVMYTSGSTGKPKGVEIDHRAICRCVIGDRLSSLRSEHSCLISTSITFDPISYEIWACFMNGATAVVYPAGMPQYGLMADYIIRYNVTHAFLATSLFHGLMEDAPPSLGGLQQMLTGGEAMSRKAALRFLERYPDTLLINGYGPTENTVFSSFFPIRPDIDRRMRTIPIGKPSDNSTCFILDEQGNLCPIGVPGILWVGGDGVAKGYRGRPELNAERFRVFPNLQEHGRLYRTGDRVRWIESGDIEFLGREDFQVKVRGFRIELPEIEQALNKIPAVQRSLVTTVQEDTGQKRLIAYVELGDAMGRVTANEIEEALKAQLPYYMVPSTIVAMQRMPLTSNGKIDRKALPDPNTASSLDRQGPVVPPRTKTEKKLMAVWASILPYPVQSIEDDFLVLGGDSLRAIRMLMAVEREFGKRISYQALLTAPTIAKMASLLDGDMTKQDDVIVPLRESCSRSPVYPPLLFVHGHGYHSGIHTFRVLLPYLNPDIAVFGLQGGGMDGQPIRAKSVQEMASDYVDAIERVFKDTTPILVCYCAGIAVSYEIYRQLSLRGRRPPGLIGIEAFAPRLLQEFTSTRQRKIRDDVLNGNGPWIIRQLKGRFHGLPKRVRDNVANVAARGFIAAGKPVPEWAREGYLRETHQRLFEGYEYPSLEAHFHVIRCLDSYLREDDYGWQPHIAGELEVIKVDMPHDMLWPRHAGKLAEAINDIVFRHDLRVSKTLRPLPTLMKPGVKSGAISKG